MKDGFKGFYNPSGDVLEGIWNSHDTIFVFDTNVYLNIYSYAEETKADLFSVLEKIKDNLWVPNHVALEYQKRRLDVIDRERENFTKITNVFNKFNNQINVEIIQNLGIEKKLPELHKSLCDFLSSFNGLCDDFIKGVFEEQRKLKPDVRSSDDIRKKLDSILSGKVGKGFTQAELDKIYEEGEFRFANKIPPGFKDAGKGGDSSDFTYIGLNYKRKFGDLIIWKQLINEASRDEVKNVVFITDDKKHDWWYGVGDKIIGPQERLQSEFYSMTAVDNFKMYDTVDFLKDAILYLGTKVDEKSLDDVKKASASSVINFSSNESSDLSENYTEISKSNSIEEAGNSEGSDIEDNAPLKGYRGIQESIRRAGLGLERLREQEEVMRRAGLGLDRLREQEEAMRRAGLGLERLREQEEAMRRGLGLERLREQEEVMRRAGLGLDRLREQEEVMRRGLGLDRLREQEEAMRRGLGLERFREQEEAMRRAGLGLESLREQDAAIRRNIWDLERHRERGGEIKSDTSDEADTHLKEAHKKNSIKKNNNEGNDQNSEDDSD